MGRLLAYAVPLGFKEILISRWFFSTIIAHKSLHMSLRMIGNIHRLQPRILVPYIVYRGLVLNTIDVAWAWGDIDLAQISWPPGRFDLWFEYLESRWDRLAAVALKTTMSELSKLDSALGIRTLKKSWVQLASSRWFFHPVKLFDKITRTFCQTALLSTNTQTRETFIACKAITSTIQ